MTLSRFAVLAAVATPLLAPLSGTPAARAAHCPAGSRLVTAAPLWAPSAPATATQFVAYAPLGGMCAFGSLTGSCVSAVVHDNSVVTLAPNVTAGQSCVPGATDLFVVAWAP